MESAAVWALTVAGIVGLFVFDFYVVVRKPHEPTFRESARWTAFYISLAVLFGLGLWALSSAQKATEFFAGYVTEWSLSVDNLFVFLVILARFAVPALYRQRVLLVGVGIALVLRAVFIFVGAAALSAFSWVFFIFGAFLLWTAVSVAKEGGAEEGDLEYTENRVTRWARKVLPATDDYRGPHLWVRENGRRLVTPMLIVMVAIGTTDVLFALDSIPAIFGLTQDPYIVFTANAFALMGLRQLFFVVQGLLTRLIYLSYGLAVILGFIGIKLIFQALRENSLPFINGGEPVEGIPDIPTWVSLVIILVVLLAAAGASLIATRRTASAPANFYTGLVADLYEPLRSSQEGPEPYARFIAQAGEPALELGCGTGEPIIALRRMGLDVEGIDSSEDMLGHLRRKATAAGVDVVVHRQLMESFALDRRFRSIFLAGPTLTVLPNDDAVSKTLERIRAHLAPGGTALVPLFIPTPTPANEMGVPRVSTADDGAAISVTRRSQSINAAKRTLTTVLLYSRQQRDSTVVEERTWVLHWHTQEGFRELARAAGLETVAVLDDEGEHATADARSFSFLLRAAPER